MGCIQTKEDKGKEEMTEKDKIIESMTELSDKTQRYLQTMKQSKDTMKYLEMAWLAYGIMDDASSIQFMCSDLAKKLEGAKER